LIWNSDNTLDEDLRGNDDTGENWNQECAGFTMLSPYAPWVWVRCRDALSAYPDKLREDNYAALLRYRP
jgi:hypothetical protein